MFGWDFEVNTFDFEDEVWSKFVFELVIWPSRFLWKDELNPRVRCAFGNVSFSLTYRKSTSEELSREISGSPLPQVLARIERLWAYLGQICGTHYLMWWLRLKGGGVTCWKNILGKAPSLYHSFPKLSNVTAGKLCTLHFHTNDLAGRVFIFTVGAS